MYPPELTEPMRQELLAAKVADLNQPAAVDAHVGESGTALIFVNSVCGCAAAMARPGLIGALQQDGAKPDRVGSVFAGVDQAATAQARSHLAGFPPSSPSAALLKDGEVVWMLHRHQIEGSDAQTVAGHFEQAFAEHCA
jgi:putative YphP/YqiW family bacilliredoxin